MGPCNVTVANRVTPPGSECGTLFAGEGIFTAEGKDWSDKRGEVLAAFAVVVGLCKFNPVQLTHSLKAPGIINP
jgi:hypothetical protein